MYSPSLEFLKSPFENVVNLLGVVPQGHEKALKHGLYNALALLVLCVSLAAGWALYIILEPFFKPLMWAVLCGCVLYPLKYSLSKSLEGWLDSLSESSTPLLVGILIIPVQIVDDASEKIGNFLFVRYLTYIVGIIGAVMLGFLVYHYTPYMCICLIWQLGVQTNALVTWVIAKMNAYMIFTIVIGYVVALFFYWHPEKSKQFTVAACCVWMFISFFFAGLAPSFQVSVFFTLQLLLLAGFFYEVWLFHEKESQSDKSLTFFDAIGAVIHKDYNRESGPQDESPHEEVQEIENSPENVETVSENTAVLPETSAEVTGEDSVTQIRKMPEKGEYIRTRPVSSLPALTSTWNQRSSIAPSRGRQFALKQYQRRGSASHPDDSDTGTLESTKYLYGLLWACGILLFWIHMWILPVVPVLLLIYGFKHIGHYFGVWQMIRGQMEILYDLLASWCRERQDALFPTPVTGLFKLLLWGNVMILDIVKNSVNMAASTVVILGLIIFTISTIAFLAVQIYSESILLLQMGGNAINNTFVRNSQLIELLPEGWQSQVDSVLDDAYSHGRQGISKLVQQSLKDVDPVKAEQLEKQVLELWDRIYQSWMASGSPNIVGPTVTSGAVFTSWDNIMDSVQKTPEIFNMDAVVSFAKENIGTLMTVWDSIWNIFKGNISLALDFCTAVLAVVFGGGTAVINFIINLIVFFTALFYLLTSSKDMYKPVDIITSFSPVNGKKFAVALEDALASVFIASFKRAVISGLWTWLIHNLFQVKLVYIPCVMATVFGAIPFIGTYWASFPAALELYFSQDRGLPVALALLLVQFVAASVVDSAVYSEIKGGGHSYLTGLSIAGGMFCLGAEGAILGPMLLCAVYVAVNLSTSIMTESPSEPQIPATRLGHIAQIKRLNSVI